MVDIKKDAQCSIPEIAILWLEVQFSRNCHCESAAHVLLQRTCVL